MAKKVKTIFREIPVNPYSVTLWLLISNDPHKAVSELNQRNKNLGIKWADDYAAWTEDRFYNDNYLTVVFDVKSFEEATVAHEAIHIKNRVMEHAGIKHDFNNDEPEAYMVDYIVGEIIKVWKEYKGRKK